MGISPRFNFDNISQAILTVFCLIVNEDWNQILYTYVRATDSTFKAVAYIGFVVIIGNFLLL